MMNQLNKLLAGALLLLSASCTEGMLDEVPQPGNQTPPAVEDESRRTVELLIQNNLQVSGSASTKADAPIATNAENEITSMDIYVFGSLTENGKYTYQERLSYRAGETVNKTDDVYPFVLVPSAANTAVSTARLSIKKGLFVKLYCVANQSTLYTLDEASTAYINAPFTALKQTSPGNESNAIETEGIPTESDFQSKYVMHVINPDDETDIIHTPLAMSGDIAGCIDLTDINENSRLNVSIKLRRAVARFDVENNKAESRLEINSIGMAGGFATTSMFPYVGQNDGKGNKIDYPRRKFINGAADYNAINNGTGLRPAYYTYAAPDDAYLVLEGKYTNPAGEVINVAYRVSFNNIVDGNGTKVTINPNHRYTVKVNEADPYEVKLTVEVADWEEGGNLDDYHPDNTIKVTSTGSLHTNTQFASDLRWVGVNQAVGAATTLFTYVVESNSELTHELSYNAAEGDAGAGWLMVTEQKQTINAGDENSYKYTYTVQKGTATTYPTAYIVFKNKVGTSFRLVIQPRPMLGSNYANLVGDYWVAVSNSGTVAVNLASAQTACPEGSGWRLPTMNDWRQIVRSDKDWNANLLAGTDAYYEFFEGDDAATVKDVDTSVKTNLFNVTGTNAGLYVSQNYWSSDASKKAPANNMTLLTNSTSGKVSYSSVAATSTAYVRCVKDKGY